MGHRQNRLDFAGALSTTPVSTTTLIVQVTALKVGNVPAIQFLQGKVELAPKSLTQVPLPQTWLPSKQAAAVALHYEPVVNEGMTLLDKAGNRWQDSDTAGKCAVRQPDGGAWYPSLAPCTPGISNGTPPACTVGAACNGGNPCTVGEKLGTGCSCSGGSATIRDDANACTDNICGIDNGCANPDSANGTGCGRRGGCRFGRCRRASCRYRQSRGAGAFPGQGQRLHSFAT